MEKAFTVSFAAASDETIPAQSQVEVTAVEGMRLRVRRATETG